MFYYTIRPGDTIYKVAARFNVPINAILSANPGLYPYNLLIGERIMVPSAAEAAPSPVPRPTQPTQPTQPTRPGGMTPAQMNFHSTVRRLWTEHAEWTHRLIQAMLDASQDPRAATAALARNAAEMEDALRPFYGTDNAARFGSLLTEHNTLVSEMVRAMREGSRTAEQSAEKQAYANADRMAEFVASINPQISPEHLRGLLYRYLGLTQAVAAARFARNPEKEAAAYDQMKNQALLIADYLAAAIEAQFPDSFR